VHNSLDVNQYLVKANPLVVCVVSSDDKGRELMDHLKRAFVTRFHDIYIYIYIYICKLDTGGGRGWHPRLLTRWSCVLLLKDQQGTHTHTDREQHPRQRHTHTYTTRTTPQTNTSHKHLTLVVCVVFSGDKGRELMDHLKRAFVTRFHDLLGPALSATSKVDTTSRKKNLTQVRTSFFIVYIIYVYICIYIYPRWTPLREKRTSRR